MKKLTLRKLYLIALGWFWLSRVFDKRVECSETGICTRLCGFLRTVKELL